MINLAEINFTDPGIITALLTLTVLEIILGVDNIIFISIVSNRLPADHTGEEDHNGHRNNYGRDHHPNFVHQADSSKNTVE